MKYTTLILIQIFSIVFLPTAQNSTICAVKYKEYKTNLGTYNYWFYKDMYVHITEPNYKAQFINGFPVLINNVMTTQTDTLKFNKEFNEFVSDMKAQLTKAPGRVETKQYNSDTTKSSIFLDGIKKNYVVLDTLVALNKWEILDDTETFMGYKCQKATINYNNEKYIAWFTTKLPYNAGPVDFRGLPGLILKVSNSSRKFGYEAVEILLPYKGVIPMFNSVGETISIRSVEWAALVNEDNKKRKEAHDNMIKQLIKDGAIYHP